eukprot:TRINITY_DN4774_c0_g1_i1.p3 TRINITY_DN4774_c0_g1~~TRINITY_DN4774_c0_g1_i1.p3  ORF type:complete len:123 (+),score=1.16 TRINITY_DN4774_c0_g1_i1:841-1209(+)
MGDLGRRIPSTTSRAREPSNRWRAFWTNWWTTAVPSDEGLETRATTASTTVPLPLAKGSPQGAHELFVPATGWGDPGSRATAWSAFPHGSPAGGLWVSQASTSNPEGCRFAKTWGTSVSTGE